ncbi:MAG: ADP-ribose pyrophosphatase [Elusimicrobia bacterium]|nr:MAG: ADP-ribose pyrophosphatase [Elusimicrobiota bacterium]KAF0157358.1 MAG: ADP-ribose pyrophosphatase [Elusimicrobiota bacterium]
MAHKRIPKAARRGGLPGLRETWTRTLQRVPGKAVSFRVDEVRLPNGRKALRAYLEHIGAVAVLPVLDDGRIVFVRQHRYPVGQDTLEIPAGKLNGPGDAPAARARAELREETGYTASGLTRLMSFWPSTAFSTETLHVYLARGLKKGSPCPDEDEFVDAEILTFKKAWTLVRSGRIKDAKTVIALQAWKIKELENR